MRFIPIDKKKKAETLAFLAKHERSCVSLVEHIRRGRDDGFIVENDAHEKLGVISVKSRMLVCIPNARFLQNDKTVCSSFKAFLSDKKISCVNGEAEASHFIMKVLAEDGRPPLHINEYTLMTLSESALQLLRTKSERHESIPEEKQMRSDRQMHVFENMQTCAPHTESARRQSEYAAVHPVSKNAATDRGERAGFEKCKIVRCGIEDADALMPLQLAYEAEEVIPPCRMRNSAVTRKNLERILKTEYVLALRNERGDSIAKANTNALGIRWAQIGGVYTAPDFRRKGYATLLVEALAEKIVASKRFPVLYAKDGNEGAQKAYAALGFTKTGGFTIAYY